MPQDGNEEDCLLQEKAHFGLTSDTDQILKQDSRKPERLHIYNSL